MREASDKISAARYKKGEKCRNDNAFFCLVVAFNTEIFLNHLRKSPGAEAGHENGGHKRDPLGRCKAGQSSVFGKFGDSFYPSDGLAAHEEEYHKRYTKHHDNSLNKICSRLSHVSAENQKQSGNHRNDYHTGHFGNVKHHITDACETLVNRGGIGNEKNKHDDRGKGAHGRRIIS